MNLKKIGILLTLSGLFLTACTNDYDISTPLGAYDNGVLILNQGNFGGGNSSISFWSNDFSSFEFNAFSSVNPSVTLGDTAQDLGFYGDKAYVVVNLSNTIQVVNRYTLEHLTTISNGLSNPRYIAFANGNAYVTNWGDASNAEDDYVAVINLTSNSVTSSIPVAEGPERILEHYDKLYIAHIGGYGFGNSISVIEANNNTVSSIVVGDVPNSMALVNNDLYVLCGGKPSWAEPETSGSLVKINISTNTVTSTIPYLLRDHPSNLIFHNNKFYYTVDSNVFSKTIEANTIPSTPIFSTTQQGVYGVYSFAIANNKIYVGDAADYNSNGKVYIYSLTGTLENQEKVGVIPGGFYFN
ncbi:YncE family protein [Flavobacterium sp.]|jgi:YVTN family beta-propeller protein|uniref:YncE family protein n=1 Tax=Flavobacterium sp. TaxID=239 RepID=UPI0037C0C132